MFGLFSKKGKQAHLGDANSFYYNEELKRWVERGKEHEVQEESLPPPPLVSSTAEKLSQQRQDMSDPSSRYVVAGGFGRATTDPQQTNKISLVAPAAISAPQTTGFFVPAGVQSEPEKNPEPVSPVSSAKYKGFRIPKFVKPENLDCTQEEYEEKEVKKWKMKIDKREARKQGGGEILTDNGHTKTMHGSGKLQNNWLTNGHQETADFEFATQPVSSVEQVFGIEQGLEPQSTNVNQPVPLFPVDSATQAEENKPYHNGGFVMEYSGHNGQDSWMNNANQTPEVEEEINFDSWGEIPTQEGIPYQTQPANSIPQTTTLNQDQQPEPIEDSCAEPEYPGGIMESNDPYDVAWLTQTGWTNLEKCKAITVWMCQTYQENWRSWHKDDPVWDQFWNWYYDGGDEVIHPAQPAPEPIIPEEKPTDEAAQFFQSGVQEEIPTLEQFHTEHCPPAEEIVEQKLEEATTYLPENDEDIWGGKEESEIQPQENPVVQTQQEQIFVETISHHDGNKPSSKLAPWEDEMLFSVPDMWKEATLTSDDESDSGNLPFAVFNRDGMHQFLLKLDSVLNQLNCQTSNFSDFHLQVKRLIGAVEASGKHGSKQAVCQEVAKVKTEQMGSFQEMEEKENGVEIELQKKMKTLEETASTQEVLIQDLKSKLQEREVSLQEKAQLSEDKSTEIKELEKELNALRDQVEKHKENNYDLISSNEEGDKLKRENKLLKKKLLSYMKKAENHGSLSNPSSPSSVTANDHSFSEQQQSTAVQQNEVESQLSSQVHVLKKKVLQQKKSLEQKETLIVESEEAKKEVQESLNKITKELTDKEDLIGNLKTLLEQKENEISGLASQSQTQSFEKQYEADFQSEDVEVKDKRISRLEDELCQKQEDIKRLEIQLESVSKKDSLVSKLTGLLNENDQHISQLKGSLKESQERELSLIDSLSAKDVDLENVVSSLMMTHKQIFQLSEYCTQLGGDPNELLNPSE